MRIPVKGEDLGEPFRLGVDGCDYMTPLNLILAGVDGLVVENARLKLAANNLPDVLFM